MALWSRQRPGVQKDDKSAYEDDSSSDSGDFQYEKTGRTHNQAQSGKGPVLFPHTVKTMIFVYAISNQVCSKKAPTLESFCGLVGRVLGELNIASGYQSPTQCIEAISHWIERNVSEANLNGLLEEKLTQKAGRTNGYKIACSTALLDAVEHRDFSFTEVQMMKYADSGLMDRHAVRDREMIPWGESPPDQPSMLDIKRQTISWYHTSTRAVPSGNFRQTNFGGAQIPSAPGHLPQGHHGPEMSSSSNSRLHKAVYSRVARPIHKADQQKSKNNKHSWRLWVEALTTGKRDPQWIDQQLALFNDDSDYNSEHDYVKWVIEHYKLVKAELDQKCEEVKEKQRQLDTEVLQRRMSQL